MNVPHPNHIKSISVKRLFGRYSYLIPDDDKELSALNIFYGDNGAGKTTLLKLVFHLMSTSDKKGHKTSIADMPFELLEVTLNDGSLLTAKKDPQLLIGPTTFAIKLANGRSAEFNFIPNAERSALEASSISSDIDLAKLPKQLQDDARKLLQQRAFFECLAALSISTFMLTSDRMLMGDSVTDDSFDNLRLEQMRRKNLSTLLAEQRTASVTAILEVASRVISQQVLTQRYTSQSSAKIYEEVIKKIAVTATRTRQGLNASQLTSTIAGLSERIKKINARLRDYAKFGFGTRSVSSDLVQLIEGQSGNKLILIEAVLTPYLVAQERQLEEFLPIYEFVNRLVENINAFFKGKKLGYSTQRGFKVYVDNNKELPQVISPGQLSSGEQQLLLLFFNVMVARDKPSIFIIDEPEISLNVMWQRKLINSLEDLALNAEFQFVFASHSMEIIAKHRQAVISMKGLPNG